MTQTELAETAAPVTPGLILSMAPRRRPPWLGPLLLLSSLPSLARGWSPCAPTAHRARAPARPLLAPVACEAPAEEQSATSLLLALDVWLRRQEVSSVLSREQASALLEELRSDRRFWAQQRKQFSRVWAALVEGLSQETRPLEVILGTTTSGRLLDALEQMDEQPGAVNAVLRSEVVEKMLGTLPPLSPLFLALLLFSPALSRAPTLRF